MNSHRRHIDQSGLLLTADPRGQTQTKLNLATFNFTYLFAWRPAR